MGIGVGTPARIIDLLDAGQSVTQFALADQLLTYVVEELY